MQRHFIFILYLLLAGQSMAARFKVKPYAQWTFDTRVEQVVFMDQTAGYPIYMIRTEDFVRIYDTEGDEIRRVGRMGNDKFVLNNARTGFMLINDEPVVDSDPQSYIRSFKVFQSTGAPDYTSTMKTRLNMDELNYQLSDDRSIVITEVGQPWLLKLYAEDTLFYKESVIPEGVKDCNPRILASNIKNLNELITAASCMRQDSLDTSWVELSLWKEDGERQIIDDLPGELTGLYNIPDTDYFFLERDHIYESSLTLYSRDEALVTYPWKSWEIRPIDEQQVFVITEKDLNVVNLGDGRVAAMYHPIELRGIADAAYMKDWGIFLYIRYVLYFNRDGKQAFRNFILEGVDRSGQLVHRSSFGTWSTILPKITPVGQNRFSIHIENAVLLYEIELIE